MFKSPLCAAYSLLTLRPYCICNTYALGTFIRYTYDIVLHSVQSSFNSIFYVACSGSIRAFAFGFARTSHNGEQATVARSRLHKAFVYIF